MWNMMCDVMPTISEDVVPGQRGSLFSGEDANFEQLMVTMFDEKDKLLDNLRETQDRLSETSGKLSMVEKERDSLQRQIAASLPQEYASITKELNQARELLHEKEEEISELKAERNNTRSNAFQQLLVYVNKRPLAVAPYHEPAIEPLQSQNH
ncbi:hypothetical protein M8J77_003229 [Diaphorina citri]|nr:hypothetical protein M8J77_003229 [Diaphorina citri]